MKAKTGFQHAILPPLILFALALLLFWGDLFSSGVIGSTYWDTDIDYYFKLRKYAFCQDGLFPKWNTLSMCGVPLIAEIQSGLFYPFNIIFLFLPVAQAINLTIFIHLYLLSLFTYYFARQTRTSRHGAIVAAIVMGFCGPVVLSIFAGHLSNIFTITWIPLVLLMIGRIGEEPGGENYILLAIVFVFQVLAGHVQYFFYSVLFSAGYLVFKTFPLFKKHEFREWIFCYLGFGLALVLAFLMALPQLVPVLEMLSLSARRALSYSEIAQFSFPLENLLTLFAPTIFGDMIKVNYWGVYNLWEMCIYSGVLPLLLAALAIFKNRDRRHVYFFLFAAIIALVIGLGEHTPFLRILYHFVPGFGLFRGHSKTVVILCFCIATLAGTGFDSLAHLRKERRRIFAVLFVCIALASVGMIVIVNYSGVYETLISSMLKAAENDPRRYLPVPGSNDVQFVQSVITMGRKSVTVFIVLFFTSCSLIYVTKRLGFNKILRNSAIVFVCVDMLFFASKFVFGVDSRTWNLKPQVMQFLEKDKSPYRVAVLTSRSWRYGSTSFLERIGGNYPYVLERYSRFFNLANMGEPVASMKIGPIRMISPAYNVLNLKYLILDSGTKPLVRGYDRVYDDGDFAIYENTNCLDRVFISHRLRIARDEDSALRYFFEAETISGRQIVLEKDVSDELTIDTKNTQNRPRIMEKVHIAEYKPDVIRIKAKVAQRAWIYLGDTFYPGWQATIDNSVKTEIFVANYLFRAICVPEGEHEITLRYVPTNFFVSKLVSLMCVMSIIVYFVVRSSWFRARV